ncbi:MAG: methyl-accepting chemotaxis protein [Rubellimicrobium sp.]|nr:methyl-accepting chemotaxis protein [Rubellimicrobium sp.]
MTLPDRFDTSQRIMALVILTPAVLALAVILAAGRGGGWTVPVLAAALAIGAGGVARLILRGPRDRIARLVTVIGRLAERDLAADPGTNWPPDLAPLAAAVGRLRDGLLEGERLSRAAAAHEAALARRIADHEQMMRALGAGLDRFAAGDLAARIDRPAGDAADDLHAPLCDSFNAAFARVGTALAEARGLGARVREASREITRTSRDLSSRAEAQAATLEQSAAALNQLTASIGSTAEHAAEAQRASVENHTGADAGAQVAREAVAAMAAIERSSEQITRIIGVIDDIAFQTNLLALNAGVEAARAGEAGRGFAVVASEVRVLARRASDAAREIKELIVESSQQVASGSELVGRAGASLSGIVERAKEAAALVADIAVAAAEQASGINELNSGISQLDQVTQQSSAMAEESSAAAATLLRHAEDLAEVLSGFRTGDEDAAPNVTPLTRHRPPPADRAAERTPPDPPPATARNGTGDAWHEF